MRIKVGLASAQALLAMVLSFVGVARAAAGGDYGVSNVIKIGGAGGWDYATLDASGERLFLPRGVHTLVIDTASGKTLADIAGGNHLHGTALAPEVGRAFVTDGGGGVVLVIDLKTYAVLGSVPAADDADGIVFDPASNHVFVTCGDAQVLVPISVDVDPKSGKADAAIELGGKPEFLVSDGQGKLYVNIADKAQIAVVDTKSMKVVGRFSTEPGERPTGMAMDRAKGRLYVGCRNKKMIVMDAKNGAILADLPIGPGVDATAFADGTGWASCVDGTLYAVQETSPGKFEIVRKIQTAVGAKTMALDAHTGTIYLPTADMTPATNPIGRPKAVPGTFKVVVVAKSK